MSKKPVLI